MRDRRVWISWSNLKLCCATGPGTTRTKAPEAETKSLPVGQLSRSPLAAISEDMRTLLRVQWKTSELDKELTGRTWPRNRIVSF